MGRWAQQKRRGGGGGGPPPPPPGPSLFNAQDTGGGNIVLQFDGPITVDSGAVPDLGAFTLDGNPVTVTAATGFGGSFIAITQTVDPSAGMLAAWTSQPPWILTPINLASSAPVA